MSTVNTLRTGIHTAIGALAGLTTVQRYDALRVEDAFDISKRRPALVVIYQGRTKGNGPLSSRSPRTNMGALYVHNPSGGRRRYCRPH